MAVKSISAYDEFVDFITSLPALEAIIDYLDIGKKRALKRTVLLTIPSCGPPVGIVLDQIVLEQISDGLPSPD